MQSSVVLHGFGAFNTRTGAIRGWLKDCVYLARMPNPDVQYSIYRPSNPRPFVAMTNPVARSALPSVRETAKKTRAKTHAPAAAAPTTDQIYARILTAILERRLLPGTQLIEERLANIFSVSRTKVREAIGRLVHDCIAINIPNRGAFVSSPSVEQAREVFAARRLIEPALVRIVAAQVTAKQVAVLRAHLKREDTARQSADQRAIVALSGEFHFLLADMAGNSFLSRTLRELETLSALVIILFGASDSYICPGDHPALVDAIEAGDKTRAAKLMLHHLEHVERSIDLREDDKPSVTLEDIFTA